MTGSTGSARTRAHQARSGVVDKLSVTAEMSTTKRSDAGLEMGWGWVVVGKEWGVV